MPLKGCVNFNREEKILFSNNLINLFVLNIFIIFIGIFNSFPEKEKRVSFLQKYYQLLLHKMFPIKEPKLLLHGKSNSGKTCWFYTFEGEITFSQILEKYFICNILFSVFKTDSKAFIVKFFAKALKLSLIYHLGIISTHNIAGVTQEGKFAGHMINESTDVVFMDEWTSNSLSCEDAKRVLGTYHRLMTFTFPNSRKKLFRIIWKYWLFQISITL